MPVEYAQLVVLLDRLGTDAVAYFDRAETALTHVPRGTTWPVEHIGRDHFWAALPQDIRDEAGRLAERLLTMAGQIASAVRRAPLASEADQRDVMIGTKSMRAALYLREFRSWTAEILHDEDVVLGVHPAGEIGKGLTFHGLRHTVGKRLADAGCDTRDIQAWLGHKTAAMSELYAKEADQKLRVKGAVAKLDSAARKRITAEDERR